MSLGALPLYYPLSQSLRQESQKVPSLGRREEAGGVALLKIGSPVSQKLPDTAQVRPCSLRVG